MLSLPSQLLLRSSELFETGHWAFINPTEADIFNELDNPNLVGLHQFYHHFSECKNLAKQPQFFNASFDLQEMKLGSFDGVVIYLPKSKQQLALLIENACALVKENGLIMVVGENKSGIKSVAKILENAGPQANKVDSAKHCGLYAVTVTEPKPSFNLQDYAVTRTYTINDQAVKVYSLPGVFGHKQLDPATELLLSQYSTEKLSAMKGEFYDFACGTGVIAAYLGLAANKYKSSIKITMSDVSSLAIYCAEQTMQLNELEANIVAADGLVQQNRRFDIIVSNPPFHNGIRTDYKIAEDFINQAFSRSVPYASITIVANTFLPYPDILEDVYANFTELASSNKYKVYEAIKLSKEKPNKGKPNKEKLGNERLSKEELVKHYQIKN